MALTPLPRTQMMVAMMEMAVAVSAGGAKLVMYCMIDTWKFLKWEDYSRFKNEGSG